MTLAGFRLHYITLNIPLQVAPISRVKQKILYKKPMLGLMKNGVLTTVHGVS